MWRDPRSIRTAGTSTQISWVKGVDYQTEIVCCFCKAILCAMKQSNLGLLSQCTWTLVNEQLLDHAGIMVCEMLVLLPHLATSCLCRLIDSSNLNLLKIYFFFTDVRSCMLKVCMFDRTDESQWELEKTFLFLLSSILWYPSAQGLTKPGSPEDWAKEN